MPTLTISQIEYSNRPDSPIIHIFGRDQDGNAQRVDVTGFFPYFFIPPEQQNRITPEMHIDPSEYRSIRNEPLTKIYCDKPSVVYDNRDKFTHYEGDVHFTTQFLIDTKIKSGVEYPQSQCSYEDLIPKDLNFPARACIIDIECSDEHGFPDSQKDPICCITAYDSFTKKYSTFLYAVSDPKGATARINGQKPKENGCFGDMHSMGIFTNEKALLEAFAKYIHDTDPDILTGWNFVQFDMPYIHGRMEVLGLKKESLARLSDSSQRAEIRGRQIFDLLAGYKRMHLGEQPSYRLDAIAFAETGKQKVRFPGKVCELWKDDPVNLVFYNFTDVELCVAIDKKDETIEFHRHVAQYVGCPIEKTTNSMPLIDVLILREAHENGYILPSKATTIDSSQEGFEGATVIAPTVGIQDNVIVLDLKSLYPMSMMTVNASPETKDPNGELRAPNGIRFKKNPDGLVRKIQERFLKERDDLKKERNKHPFGSQEYKSFDMRQDVVKINMNSYYGVSGNPMFRLYDRDVAAATTSIGRAILEHNKQLIDACGYKIVQGDTDGVAVKIPSSIGREGTMAIAKDLEKMLNDSYASWAKETLGADVQYFSVKFEKLYERFFSAGKKKRYAGLLVWKEGVEAHEVTIVGFETERSDSPKVTRDAMKLLIGMVLEGKKYEEIQPVISEIVRKYRAREYPLDEIGIPGGIGKDLEDYDRPDAQVRAAIYSNRWFKTHFGKGSKPKRLYIKSVPMGYPRTDVICFEYPDEVPPGFVLDIETMLEKTLQQPLTRILEALNWNWAEFDPATPTLAKWGLT